METQRTWPLAMVVTFHCAWAIGAAMALYAGFEVVALGESVLAAFLRHTAHVLVLGALLLVVLTIAVRFQLTRPILRLNAMLYRLGAGEGELPPLQTKIRELKDIERGIETMKARMHMGETGKLLEKAGRSLTRLRELAQGLHDRHPAESEEMTELLVRLGESLGLATQWTAPR